MASLLLISILAFASSDCDRWFRNAKIAQSDSQKCELICASTKVDMATFQCHEECPSLCEASGKKPLLGKYLYYPGLTEAEKALIEELPKEAILVFIQKEKAEILSESLFPNGRPNDESDAFRHFYWAGLLTNAFGPDTAQKFLDAHEENPSQPAEEKAMDLANNRGGILSANKMIKEKTFSESKLKQEALSQLKNGKLTVLKPNNKGPEGFK